MCLITCTLSDYMLFVWLHVLDFITCSLQVCASIYITCYVSLYMFCFWLNVFKYKLLFWLHVLYLMTCYIYDYIVCSWLHVLWPISCSLPHYKFCAWLNVVYMITYFVSNDVFVWLHALCLFIGSMSDWKSMCIIPSHLSNYIIWVKLHVLCLITFPTFQNICQWVD